MKNGNANLQVPVRFQRELLGLDEKVVSEYSSLECKGLDIGCGNGLLVNELREKGLLMEGMDAEAPDNDYFIRQLIYGMKPMEGCIPRSNDCYDLVVCFQNIILNRGFTIRRDLRNPGNWNGSKNDMDDHTERLIKAQFIIYEGARIVRPNGRFVVYPQLKKLEDSMGSMLSMQGIRFFHEDVSLESAREYIDWETERTLGCSPEVPNDFFKDWGLYKRTILTKD